MRAFDAAFAGDLARRRYGILGDVDVLVAERDHNFRIGTAQGAAYVLKISHPDESIDTVRFQNAALMHIASADPALAVPVVVRDVDGGTDLRVDVDGTPRIVRMLTYLDGTMLHRTAASPDQDHGLGAFLARLGLALRDFSAAGVNDELIWDLRRLARSRHFIDGIPSAGVRSMVERAYDACDANDVDLLDGQPIHNDMNPYNVVMHPHDPSRVRGMIDFGDMVHGPLACDIAVGAAYRWSLQEHPLAGAARFVRGYDSVRPLEEETLALLTDLIRARLALTINVSNWQSLHDPGNRDYVLRAQTEMIRALHHLSTVDRADGTRFLRLALSES